MPSVAARFGGSGGAGLYASAKGFILTYTRNLARELAGDGTRANQVVPGLISRPFHEGITSAEQMKQFQSMIPLGRVGQAEDCVGAFLFLASEAAIRGGPAAPRSVGPGSRGSAWPACDRAKAWLRRC
jgi:3-oxoacyl-[acyl-carrier protein] reductase